ncbi:uncharacterized protein I303_100861 [Kwoniella dejecticola CBS 10117]|uniref:Uncharacterized protein n=1 Tax=Kwoniella dejecticola CBS 10117 TaxID=1296121 RepID=A0A1A6AG35_9TREE|nr:uncharacterized protein I303_00864 [Kwoniella dejecticola CBS 10117]OBR89042.1 hypothetical protein I303_00864 [Kwoniella dejecticola CBS 10117]
MAKPKPSTLQLRLNSIYTPILLTLTVLSIYLITGSLITNRPSPPVFLTAALGLVVAAYRPNLLTALISIGVVLFIDIFLAIDYVHGECWYDVLVGGKSWHKERLGELAWYTQCVQPAQAWWIMAIVGLLWLSIAVVSATSAASSFKSQ